MSRWELYRDDDPSVTTDINLFVKVHRLFLQYDRIHRVAVLFDNLWENRELWFYLVSAPKLEIAWHGRTHKDYGKLSYQECRDDIQWSLEMWQARVSRGGYKVPPIRYAHPPWHSVSPELARACADSGIVLDARQGPPVFNFHYWSTALDPRRFADLEQALRQ